MNTKIKLPNSELEEIKSLQNSFQEHIFKLGNLQVEKIELDKIISDFIEKEKALKNEWGSLQKREQLLLNKIVNNYGEGNLNMNDGTFELLSEKK